MIKGIIFDLDGTLADTMPDLQTAMNRMLKFIGYSERTRVELIGAINNGAKEFVRRSLPNEVQDIDFILKSALREYEKQYSMCYLEKTAPYENVEAMLMNLKQKGLKLAVLSNKQDKFVKDIVSKLFDRKTFSVVQGHDKLPLKPNPSSALAIAKKMGVKPSQCLIVGDSDVDIQTAKEAGMESIGASWGYRGLEALENAGATFIIEDPNDVCSIIDYLKSVSKTKNAPKSDLKDYEFFNRKLVATSDFEAIKQNLTGETAAAKNSNSTGEHTGNVKKKKGL